MEFHDLGWSCSIVWNRDAHRRPRNRRNDTSGFSWSCLAESFSSNDHRKLAAIGIVLAFALVPFVPPGIPVIAAASAVIFLRPWRDRGSQ